MATDSSSNTLKDSLIYLKKKLERTTDEEAILRIIHKLSKIPITIELLQGTGAGKIMRVLAKKSGNVGLKASSLLNKWRGIVADTQKSNETSSLKENDHPKKIHHESSKTHHKHTTVTKTYEIQSSEKNFKDKYYEEKQIKENRSKNEKSSKDKHYHERDTKSEHSKEKLKMYPKEDFNSKKKHSAKRLSEQELEHEYKKKHAKETGANNECKSIYFHHSHKQTGKSSSSKNEIDKSSSNSHSKKKKLSSKLSSSDKQENHYSGNSDSEYPEHEFNDSESGNNSDSSASCELSPKHSNASEIDRCKYSIEFKTKKSSHSVSSRDRKNISESEKSSKKKISKSTESKTKDCSGEKHTSEKLISKSKSKKSTKKDLKMLSTEEFTSSEATFEDCLSFNDIVPLKKKKSSKPVSNSSTKKRKEPEVFKKPKKIKISEDNLPKDVSRVKEISEWKVSEEMIEKHVSPERKVDISSTLPQTQPNYRPLPQRQYDYSPVKKRENMSNEDAIKFTSSRKEKTAVYSGRKNKTNYLTAVPTLFECCTRVLIDNIDDIEYMGVVPYFLLEQMLQRCSPSQLYRIEDFNPYLLEDTNELWEIHCKRDFRTAKPEESETWRELYWRSHDEREKRLRSVTANISALIANSNPTRKAKLAYVDSVVKPPRDVARRQAKHGTALPTNHTVKAGPPSKASPRPTAPIINSTNAAASTSRPRAEAKPMKPKVAPLMAKTLKSMKQCFRR